MAKNHIFDIADSTFSVGFVRFKQRKFAAEHPKNY